jgi:hypothetical protein
MKKLIRFGFIAIIANLLMSMPVDACLGRGSETSIFFNKKQTSKFKTDLLIRVTLEDFKDWAAHARITEIIQAPVNSLRRGDKILLKYHSTSCGPNHKTGEEGIIFAKMFINKNGHKTFYPYLIRGDGRIFPPDS